MMSDMIKIYIKEKIIKTKNQEKKSLVKEREGEKKIPPGSVHDQRDQRE